MPEDFGAAPNVVLRVHLLGEPYLVDVRENREIALPSRCLALLGTLLLNRKMRLRERIAAALWPDVRECESRANLRRALHRLVRVLPNDGRPWLTADSQRLEWNDRAPFWCDVDAFEQLGRRSATQAEAVEIYGGDLLADDETEWIVERRARLRERQLELLRTLAETSQIQGDRQAAATYWRRMLELDPFREDAFRSLLIARSASGDRAGAACDYHAFVRNLRSEVGVDPMPETVACFEGIARARELAFSGTSGR